MTWTKRLLGVGLFVCVITAAVVLTVGKMHSQQKLVGPPGQQVPPSVNAKTPAPKVPASPKTGKAGHKRPAEQEKPAARRLTETAKAVKAATTALRSLTDAQFLPNKDMQVLLSGILEPAKVPGFVKGLAAAAPIFAEGLGYQNVDEAQRNSGYYVIPQKYRVLFFNGQVAQVSIYALLHLKPSAGAERWVPEIEILSMKRQGTKWLFNGYITPSGGQAPKPLYNLTYQQTVERFLPYLKGYKDYESSP